MTLKHLRRALTGLAFNLPWLAGFVLLTVFPLVRSFLLSLAEVKITNTEGIVTKDVGLANYAWAFVTDTEFVTALLSSLQHLLVAVPVIVIFACLIALMLSSSFPLRGLFRTLFFLPVVIMSGPLIRELSSQGASTIPQIEKYGILAFLRDWMPGFLADPLSWLFSQLILILWFSGVQILVFLAALQKLDPAMNEAASIDGANAWERFWKITLPTLKPLMLVNALYTIVQMSTFSENEIILLITSNLFNVATGFGYASALAWSQFAVTTLLLGLCVWLLRPARERRPE
ncbi:MAG: sugar ABC transporter permease [Spirochaetales bacterium]